MSDSNDQAAGVLGAGGTAATAAAMAKSGVPISLILGGIITVLVIGAVVYFRFRQPS